MLLAATGDDRLDPSLANLLAVFVMVVAAIGGERIRTLGAGCASAGSHAGGQVAQGRGGHIDAGRVDKHAEAPGRTGDLGREPVYQELLHVRTPTPTSTTRPRTQAGKGSLTGMRRMVTRSAWYPESAADQSAPHRAGHAADADPRGGQDRSLSPSPHGRTLMIVFPLRRSVGLRAATASSRIATLPMFVRSRPSRTRRTTSPSWARSDSTTKSTARPSSGRVSGGPTTDTNVPPARIRPVDRFPMSPPMTSKTRSTPPTSSSASLPTPLAWPICSPVSLGPCLKHGQTSPRRPGSPTRALTRARPGCGRPPGGQPWTPSLARTASARAGLHSVGRGKARRLGSRGKPHAPQVRTDHTSRSFAESRYLGARRPSGRLSGPAAAAAPQCC